MRRELFLCQAQACCARRVRSAAASAGSCVSVAAASASAGRPYDVLSLIASKWRQLLFGGLFGLSLNLVILPFFMWLRSSRGK